MYGLTQNINDILHSQANIKNFYHRMTFTSTSMVVIYFDNNGDVKTLKTSHLTMLLKQAIRLLNQLKCKIEKLRLNGIW